MNGINSAKFHPMTSQEMNAIMGGKKHWVRNGTTVYTKVDCPEEVKKQHPGLNCYTSEEGWNYVNNSGRVIKTEMRPDTPEV